MHKRRKLILAFGATALGAPLASFAQQSARVWRVGFLSLRGRPVALDADFVGAFPRAMRELGYVEGKNLVIEWNFADGKVERLPTLAAELVQLKVDVIVVGAASGVGAAQKATTTIPIVMVNVGDPVGNGFVKSLPHPGGNITGLSNLSTDLGPKHLEMLLSMAPRLSRVAVLVNPDSPNHIKVLESIEAAGQKRRLTILPVQARTPQEFEQAFARMKRENAGALIVSNNPIFTAQARQTAEVAAKNRLPSVAPNREYAEAGGLMSYGSSNSGSYRRAASYVDKLLKGAKPADLPVEQPTKFELIINGKTAKALGLTISQELRLRADKVIE